MIDQYISNERLFFGILDRLDDATQDEIYARFVNYLMAEPAVRQAAFLDQPAPRGEAHPRAGVLYQFPKQAVPADPVKPQQKQRPDGTAG